jgi:hypothetical protein
MKRLLPKYALALCPSFAIQLDYVLWDVAVDSGLRLGIIEIDKDLAITAAEPAGTFSHASIMSGIEPLSCKSARPLAADTWIRK